MTDYLRGSIVLDNDGATARGRVATTISRGPGTGK